MRPRNAGVTLRPESKSFEQVQRSRASPPSLLGDAAAARFTVARKPGELNLVCLTPEPNASFAYLSARLGWGHEGIAHPTSDVVLLNRGLEVFAGPSSSGRCITVQQSLGCH